MSLVVAVTGASGFVGRRCCAVLRERGVTVRALVRSAAEGMPEGVQRVPYGGLDDEAGLRAGLAGADAVVHLAARVHILRDGATDPLAAYRDVNLTGTETLLRVMSEAGVPRLIMASSVKAVAEEAASPLTRYTPARPADPYGVSKLEAESRAMQWAASGQAELFVLRFPLVYGPGVRANMYRLFEAVWRRTPIPVARTPNRRSMLFVGNAAAAIAGLLALPVAAGRREIAHVSDGPAPSMAELLEAIGRALGRKPRTVSIPDGLLAWIGGMGDALAALGPWPVTSAALNRLTRSLVVDENELPLLLGHDLPFSLEAGIAETSDWFRQERLRR